MYRQSRVGGGVVQMVGSVYSSREVFTDGGSCVQV